MSINIRMYNTGFGDCFLLTFPAPGRPRKVLIDCGRHQLSEGGPKLSRVVQQVLSDIEEPDGPRIDVVVATHRHQDHLQGFAAKGWDDVRVSEVWMPWVEDPDDPVAREICKRQSTKVERLRTGVASIALAADDREYMLAYAGNNLTNAAAMKLLHNGFQGEPKRRFLPGHEPPNHITTPVLPGVEVYVLGPSRDPEAISEMEPPPDESFLRARQISALAAKDRPDPFDARWALTRAAYENRTGEPLPDDFPVECEQHIGEVGGDAMMEVAARVEGAINSTSLVLLFHIGDAWMLFPGDAQWATWSRILNQPESEELFRNLAFYKAGHHGSHNANPTGFVKKYVNKRVRMMIPYGTVKKWPLIPRPGLIDYLNKKRTAYARSDQPPGNPFRATKEGSDNLYIDCEIAGD